jgi:hypothetical protein
MRPIAIIVLAAITLVGPAFSVAGATVTAAGSKPSSYVPQTGTHNHIYGTPIQPPILGHAKASHRRQAQKKTSTSAANRKGAHLLPRHH